MGSGASQEKVRREQELKKNESSDSIKSNASNASNESNESLKSLDSQESDADDHDGRDNTTACDFVVSHMVGVGAFLLALLFIRDETRINPIIPTVMFGTYIYYKNCGFMGTYKIVRKLVVTEPEIKPSNSLLIVKWVPEKSENSDEADLSEGTEFTVDTVTENLLNLIHAQDCKGKLNLRFRDSKTRTLYLNA